MGTDFEAPAEDKELVTKPYFGCRVTTSSRYLLPLA